MAEPIACTKTLSARLHRWRVAGNVILPTKESTSLPDQNVGTSTSRSSGSENIFKLPKFFRIIGVKLGLQNFFFIRKMQQQPDFKLCFKLSRF